MFSGLFQYDNPVWRFIGKFFDIMILNILWCICSIPVFTIGASTTAAYYVTLKLVRDEDGSTIKDFFRAFKDNFKQATGIWLILLVLGLVIGADMYFFTRVMEGNEQLRSIMIAVFAGFALMLGGVFTFVFPLQCRFYNPVKRTLLNAWFMSIRHFLATLGILAVDILFPYLAFAYATFLIPLFMLFGFPLLIYLNSFMIAPILEKYMPKKEEPEDRFGADVWEMPELSEEQEGTGLVQEKEQ